MGLPTHNTFNLRRERVYFTGSNTLAAGQPVCFQESVATASSTKGFPFDVEIPNTANALAFAGIVAEDSAGVTGPDFIDIIVPAPGDILEVFVSNATDVALGDIMSLNFDVPTAAGTEVGAFQVIGAGTVATSLADSVIRGVLNGVVKSFRCRALDTLGSTTAGNETQNLLTVQFT